jgi:CrcB protein
MHWVVVFLGGGIGAALRHGVNRGSLAYLGPDFPCGTLFVNIVGSLLMGALAGIAVIQQGLRRQIREAL